MPISEDDELHVARAARRKFLENVGRSGAAMPAATLLLAAASRSAMAAQPYGKDKDKDPKPKDPKDK